MGEVVIDLLDLDPSGAAVEMAVPLECSGRMKTVSGTVRTVICTELHLHMLQ